MPTDTTTQPTSADALTGAELAPRLLEEGERIELWLASPDASGHSGDQNPEGVSGEESVEDGEPEFDGWDVRPAEVSAVALPFIAVAAGGWGLSGAPGTPSAPGARAILRRIGGDGIAEWEGTIATGAEPVPPAPADALDANPEDVDAPRRATHLGIAGTSITGTRAAEAILVVRLGAHSGAIHQRRRSPRLSLRLSPVRLVALAETLPPAGAQRALAEDADLAPVARLSDVSAHGAAIVVDEPLEMGTTVAIEFELPGEADPFTVRGRVVEPAVALHGDAQPQADGLPGFRRGIEFLGHTAGRESRRFAAVLARLLQSDASRREQG